ncbi:MAG TPA: hypothetical protein VEG08_01525 [Terriglobales bacterium]|nr:hypothetical protein [Terriglobales bacterium]
MREWSGKFLMVYSGVLTIVFGATLLTGLSADSRVKQFDEISVHRINVVEPDGTLRMVISDRASFPGSFVKGKEIARADRKATGLLFLDDEGTEMGGLIFGGGKNKDGAVASNGHLSFDQYMQDQVFTIDAGESNGHRYSALVISDRGDYPITEAFEAAARIRALPPEQQRAAWLEFYKTHPGDQNRIILGRYDGSVLLRMKDTQERDRIVMKVDVNGQPTIQLLDEHGKVIGQLPPKQ